MKHVHVQYKFMFACIIEKVQSLFLNTAGINKITKVLSDTDENLIAILLLSVIINYVIYITLS